MTKGQHEFQKLIQKYLIIDLYFVRKSFAILSEGKPNGSLSRTRELPFKNKSLPAHQREFLSDHLPHACRCKVYTETLFEFSYEVFMYALHTLTYITFTSIFRNTTQKD